MKMGFLCSDCHLQGDFEFEYIELDSSNDGLYHIKCNKGHKSSVFLQAELFELLFDSGGMALMDGYPREAVASFAAALERFYEYCIKIFLNRSDIEYKEYSSAWKMVQNQSERQFGAFVFLYLKEFKTAPLNILEKKMRINNISISAFRNRIIHKGLIPRSEEVKEFGEELYNYMISILKIIKRDYQEEMINVIFDRQKLIAEKNADVGMNSFTTIPTMINLYIGLELFGQSSFEKSLEELKRSKGSIYRV